MDYCWSQHKTKDHHRYKLLKYDYDLISGKVNQVSTADLKNQSAFNYQYDAIGELTQDTKNGITGATWNVYGKLLAITNASGTITFTYDPASNRISKTASGN